MVILNLFALLTLLIERQYCTRQIIAVVINIEEHCLSKNGEIMVLLKKQHIIGFFALLPSGSNQIDLKSQY